MIHRARRGVSVLLSLTGRVEQTENKELAKFLLNCYISWLFFQSNNCIYEIAEMPLTTSTTTPTNYEAMLPVSVFSVCFFWGGSLTLRTGQMDQQTKGRLPQI